MIEPLKDLDLSEELYHEPQEQKREKGSGFFSTLTFQVILCLVIAIALVLLNTFFPTQYADIDRTLTDQVQNDGGFSEDIKNLWDSLTGNKRGEAQNNQQINSGLEESVPPVSESGESVAQSETVSQAAGGVPNREAAVVPANATLDPVSYSRPVVLPLSSIKITSAYGVREHPITGERDFHNGMDLAADEGADIYAVAAGTVVESEYSKGYGNHIRIRHADGSDSFYAHCSELLFQKGDAVKQGTVIAKVGSTGMSTGPHLHFSFLIGGKYVNPADIIKDA